MFELLKVRSVMHDFRKAWAPPASGTGSQQANWQVHANLAQTIRVFTTKKMIKESEWG